MRDVTGRSTAAACLIGGALAVAVPQTLRAAETADTNDSGEGVEAGPRRTIVVYGAYEKDANPNANREAPYKVERSQNDKFTEALRDTPKTVTVIPKEVIEDTGATSFREVVRSTPGVTLGTGEGGNAFGDRIFIRGFEARNDVYIDGLRDPGVTSREIFAVEQIEVVKGPSATYGGRGTTGGLVSLQSKRAMTDRTFVEAEGGVGTEHYLRGTLDANAPLAPGLALRLNALYHDADTPGRDHVEQKRWGIAGALTAEATPTLTFRADYYHFDLDGIPDYGQPFDPATQEPVKVDRDLFYGVLARDFIRNKADVGTLAADFKPIGDLAIHASVRYGKTSNRYIVSAPENPDYSNLNPSKWTVTANPKNSNRTNSYWAGSLYAVARIETGPVRHDIVFGGDYSDEQVRNRPYSINSTSNGSPTNPVYTSRFGVVQNLFDPDPFVAFPFSATAGPLTRVDVQSLAAYAIDTMHFGEKFSVIVGARFDTYDLDYFAEASSSAAGLQPQSLAYNADFLNWQASATYKPVEALTIYASFATSSNPSGEQIDGNGVSYDGISPQTVNLEPERNRAWEGGVKWETAGGKLLLTGAAFQITKDNARENLGGGVYALAGKLRSRGVEFGVSGTVFDRLQLFGGYTYTDAKIVESATPANVGAHFANIPKHSGSLLATVLVAPRVEIGGQVYAQSRIYGGTTAAGTAHVPGYARFDAVARWKPTDWLEARVNVLNLTDKRYFDAIYRSSTPFAYVAPGRSGMLTLAVKY